MNKEQIIIPEGPTGIDYLAYKSLMVEYTQRLSAHCTMPKEDKFDGMAKDKHDVTACHYWATEYSFD